MSKEMKEKEYLDKFEQTLLRELLKVCTQQGRLSGEILPSPDLDDKWEQLAEPYMADAIKEIAGYPTVAVGWMMYLGMAVAHYWDLDWAIYGNLPDLYGYIRDKRGFDYMDEHIRETILCIKPSDPEFDRLEDFVRLCATLCITHIRRENVEPQSPRAFHIYIRVIHAMYLIGTSMELFKHGYKMKGY